MKTKILIVEDERDIVEFLTYNLELENFTVIAAHDGEEGLKKMSEKPDIVLLDIMMPKMDGYEVCRRIRENKQTAKLPVIFLTAKSSEYDELRGLDLGANDYILKPVSPAKLVAKVKSTLRNVSNIGSDENETLTNVKMGPIEIDREKYTVSINSTEKVFPRKEFELLFYLISTPGTVYNRATLLRDVWGSDVFVVDRTVDVHIRKIREKLDEYQYLIETVKGVGYRFKEIE
ncbi:MAG: response regulator transcription factor [Ignavibacteriales bacterium]|jgi:two-component system alkaline phosphatase synthesis response regulator PhoP|nr:response regulator transcription factor [Ignavibacteriales bacterium]MBK7264906.1 response regulator transcription factor [Ignavibacteriales bacterium]MBK8662041.1 response regulator transcription factor [Ignavibacteriales bacterium]MBP7543195.1 response regulator transcription factor [Ignavibacteriaceae bacterium]MCC6637013.1 response regulator transcription factor [Ignavibacteriaceae bacterium]